MQGDAMKVFIASSGRAERLALRVQYQLTELCKIISEFECHLWCADSFPTGEYLFDTLREKSGSVDFAIVCLTKDDETKKKGTDTLSPRDNCIFELGLFLGGLMFQRTRCAILTSVERCALPTDIEGIKTIRFEEPQNIDTASLPELDKAIRNQVIEIANNFMAHQPIPLLRLEIPPCTLMQFEKLDIYQGNLKPPSMVTVKRAEPLELNLHYNFAPQIQRNLEAWVKYRYFFQHNPDNPYLIPSLVQILATAGLDGQLAKDRRANMQCNKEKVVKNLRNMKQSLTIDLMTDMVPLEFCVHNASSKTHAICYLGLPNGAFVRCSTGKPAFEIAKDLMEVNPTPPDKRPIFAETLDEELDMPGVREDLREKLRELFDPSLHREMEEVCFGG